MSVFVRIDRNVGQKLLEGIVPQGHLLEHQQLLSPGRVLLVFCFH